MSRGGADLDTRLTALARALELARGRCAPALLAAGDEVVTRAASRRRLAPDRTVVALAGGTGSGKSTLFNALAGADLAPTGVRRPTTSRARAAIWPAPDDAEPLLDWLDVRDRHQVTAPAPLPAGAPAGPAGGLVLLDLPDFDSTAAAHRLEAERLTGVVDLLVWVLDPQKYADAAVHERYLRPLATHRDVMLVVLNQVDRLDPAAAVACRRHLGDLLAADGLRGVPTLGVSATRGDGLDELRGLLAHRVEQRAAASQRLHDDLDRAVAELAALDAGGTGRRDARATERSADRADAELVRALGAAAGVDAVAAAAGRSYRLRGLATVGWPPTRWVARTRVNPLRRLHLGPAQSGPSSVIPAGVAQAQVANAVRDVLADRTHGLTPVWQQAAAVRIAATQATLPAQLDQAVRTADLAPAADPGWWRAVRTVQRVLIVVAIAGALWLAALAGLSYLRLPDPTLHVGRVPVPTVLLLGGLALGLLVALAVRPVVAAGARRRAARAGRSLAANVASVAQRGVLEPLGEELRAAADFTAALRAAHR